jgi:hypothetical protein
MGKKPEESGNKPPARGVGEESTKKGPGFRSWHGSHTLKKLIIKQPRIEGKCVDLKGFIYDCSDSKQADIFTKTTKEVAEYVGRTYKYGCDARLAIENLEEPTLTLPNDPSDTTTKTETRIWEKEVDKYVSKKSYLKENLNTLDSLVWGQCTDAMRARIDAIDEHNEMSNKGNSIALLKAIKALDYNFQSQNTGRLLYMMACGDST